MPYMNTRSVTRKMYNVGATYQAPTVRDATEWKEWPAHGMHERPVFHPQVNILHKQLLSKELRFTNFCILKFYYLYDL